MFIVHLFGCFIIKILFGKLHFDFFLKLHFHILLTNNLAHIFKSHFCIQLWELILNILKFWYFFPTRYSRSLFFSGIYRLLFLTLFFNPFGIYFLENIWHLFFGNIRFFFKTAFPHIINKQFGSHFQKSFLPSTLGTYFKRFDIFGIFSRHVIHEAFFFWNFSITFSYPFI